MGFALIGNWDYHQVPIWNDSRRTQIIIGNRRKHYRSEFLCRSLPCQQERGECVWPNVVHGIERFAFTPPLVKAAFLKFRFKIMKECVGERKPALHSSL